MTKTAGSWIKPTLALIGVLMLSFSGLSQGGFPRAQPLATVDENAAPCDVRTSLATTSAEWYIETIDTTGNVGQYSSLALTSNNTVYISYLDTSNGLKVACWNGTIWSYEIVDPVGGSGVSMALDSQDRPHISYMVGSVTGNLVYAARVGAAWNIETVDASGQVSSETSIAVDSNDFPHISYRDFIDQDLEYARWNGTHWDLETPDAAGNVGNRPSLAIDSNDRPHICYFREQDDWFYYISWNGTTWNKQVVDGLDNGRYSSLKLDSADYPHASYYDNMLNDLVYSQWNGTTWIEEHVDGVGVQVGRHSSLALDSYEYPHISYYDTTNENLKYAWWNGTHWSCETVDSTGSVGTYTSIALDSHDVPHISYYDAGNQDLKYATFASPGRDVRVYGGDGPQNEVSLAVNPLHPDNIVVGFNDWVIPTPGELGGWGLSYSYTIDGGVTWTYGGRVDQGIQLEGEPWCDPWLAFDNDGYLFYVGLTNTFNREIFLAIGKPDNSGNVGPQGFRTELVDPGTGRNDKPVIAVDTTHGPWDGQFYVAWAQSPGIVLVDGMRIWLRRGTRVPGTDVPSWAGPPQQVGPDTFTQLPQVAVGPSGHVYVAYQKQSSPALASAWAHAISFSTDGGATFTVDTFVAFVAGVEVPVSPGSWARHTSGSTLGISPDTGTLFLAWTDSRYGDKDVLLVKSTDGGATWTGTPLRVNTDPAFNGLDQWSPALTVSSRGTVDLIFYDRRNDAANNLTMLYFARSSDDGNTFVNFPISDAMTNPDAFYLMHEYSLGDYVGIDSVADMTYVGWGDGRLANPGVPYDYNSEVYFDKVMEYVACLESFPLIIPSNLRLRSLIGPFSQPILTPMRIAPVEGFNSVVALSVKGLPSGAMVSFTPTSGVPPFETTMNVTTGGAAEGVYEIQVAGTYGDQTVSHTLELTITSTPYILLEAMLARPGDTLTLAGQGFTPSTEFDVFFDGKLRASGWVDRRGRIVDTLSVLASDGDGNHTILVRDTENVEASASLIIYRGEVEDVEVRDISLIRLQPSKFLVGVTYPLPMLVTVENQGSKLEQFNITIHANDTVVATKDVTLIYGENSTVTLIWETTGFSRGNYTLYARVSPLIGETDTKDNVVYAISQIRVTFPGDVDGDWDVDIFDIVRMAGGYGTTPPDPKYDLNCDIDGDGDIDIFDIVVAAGNYGESWNPLPPSRRIYVVNGGDNTVSVIDNTKLADGIPGNEVIEVIDLDFDGWSNFIAVDESMNLIYVTNAMAGTMYDQVSVIDETTICDGIPNNEVIDTLALDADPYPPLCTFWGVAVCEYHQVIWVTTPNLFGILAFDGVARELMPEGQILIHSLPDNALPLTVHVDEIRHRVYIADGEQDDVDVIDEYRLVDGIFANEVIDSITVGEGASGIAVDELRNRIYVANQVADTVSVIDGSKVDDGIPANEVMMTINVGDKPSHITVDELRNMIYVTNQLDGTISVIDGSRVSDKISGNEVVDTITVGNAPLGIAVDETNNRIYVTNHDDNTVSVINGYLVDDGIDANEVIATIDVGTDPNGVAVSTYSSP